MDVDNRSNSQCYEDLIEENRLLTTYARLGSVFTVGMTAVGIEMVPDDKLECSAIAVVSLAGLQMLKHFGRRNISSRQDRVLKLEFPGRD